MVPPTFKGFLTESKIYDHSNLPGYLHLAKVEAKHIYAKIINEMKPNPGKIILITHYQENENSYFYYDFVQFAESDDVINAI
ncbi:hypothetical protein [Candidatus Williamhamiltonella defendens]|uniref:hypothetical protein n=1 Tax=Candidatus Williamhamiltonella defendens TaxID=138072 RepID=UPI00130EB26A|nr:hypothetical protein [Candidatus Hamiltonella defensa]